MTRSKASPTRRRRAGATIILTVLALVGSMASAASAGTPAGTWSGSAGPSAPAKPTLVYHHLALSNGQTADVYSDGMATLTDDRTGAETSRLLPAYDLTSTPTGTKLKASKTQVMVDLERGKPTAYTPGRVQVVLANSVQATRPVTKVAEPKLREVGRLRGAALATAAPDYTSSSGLNATLAGLGAEKMSPLLHSPHGNAGSGKGLDLTQAYVVDLADGSVPAAVAKLRASANVAYASPAWTVSAMNVPAAPIPGKIADAARSGSTPRQVAPHDGLPALPTNYALSASAQPLLNRPGLNWTEAYETLQERYHQLPGEGETITNVSVGDLTDDNMPPSRCADVERGNGPTTIVKDGQRYLDLPSLPLIPTYTASRDGSLDPTGATCSQDKVDAEIDLDFTMMAGLPHDQQRPEATGDGYTDLLGVAPGADYRLVVPASTAGVDITDIDAALQAAAQQTPKPDVITASLGFGFDAQGFPSRYLEEDPLAQQLISSIVHEDHIVVSISSGDGLRQFTSAAVGPSGGSAATNLVPAGGKPTNLDDLFMSSAPSLVRDSGAIDVGGTTTDDIFAAPPQNPANAALAAQHAFPIVRYDGMLSFSSGFGSRVNVSAPGDNVVSYQHKIGAGPRVVDAVVTAGTSASAPLVAGAAAVVKQTARLAGGDDALASDPVQIRSWLTDTAARVPGVPQADQDISVGPQADIGNAVVTLVRDRAGFSLPSGVARVAVEQRRKLNGSLDAVFVGDTDPAAISLTDNDQQAWITIAPDWTGQVAGDKTKYALSIGKETLATTAQARLLPKQIFAAAGKTFPPTSSTTLTLTYTAQAGGADKVSTDVTLVFQPPTSEQVTPLAADVPPVTTGTSIPVHYDFSDISDLDKVKPTLIVTDAGRPNFQQTWHIRYQKVLTDLPSGTVDVPVSELDGGGVYGISIMPDLRVNVLGDFAITRVPGAPRDIRPAAPLLSTAGSTPSHVLETPYNGDVTVSWDVRDVPGATGARLEVSAPGPSRFGSFSTFNNPNGTIRDANDLDAGSVHDEPLPGTHGSVTLSGEQAGLVAAMYQQIRVRPVDKSGSAAGEASDVSTVHRRGLHAPEGQGVGNPAFGMGFGVDQRGGSGVFASSSGITISGPPPVSDFTLFDQTTNTLDKTFASSTGGSIAYGTLAFRSPAVFTGGVALYQELHNDKLAISFHTVDLDSGKEGEWNPPAGYLPPPPPPGMAFDAAAADNQTAADTAVVSRVAGRWQVFTSNVAANTFGPLHDITDALTSLGQNPLLAGIAQDPTRNTAYVALKSRSGGATDLISVNLDNGSTSTTTLDFRCSKFAGLAVDPGSHTALLAGVGQLVGGMCLVDLSDGTSRFIGNQTVNAYFWPTVDRQRGLYVVFEADPPDLGFTRSNPRAPGNIFQHQTLDSNSGPHIAVFDPAGRVVKRIPTSSGGWITPTPGSAMVQVNPATGKGYMTSGNGVELQPFTYTD